jgi:hypothetical protein
LGAGSMLGTNLPCLKKYFKRCWQRIRNEIVGRGAFSVLDSPLTARECNLMEI